MKMDKDIGFEIRVISNLIKRKVESFLNQKYNNMTGLQGRIAGYLYHNMDKEIFQRDLEEAFTIRRSTVTEVLKTMEKNGFIEKKSVDYDARLKKIILTQKSIELHNAFLEDIKEVEKIIKKDISDEELDVFFSVLEKIKDNIK